MRSPKRLDRYQFNGAQFFRAIAQTLEQRKMSWRQLALEIGATPSTFTRWGQGRSLDARTLAALSAWANLNPADFVDAEPERVEPNALTHILSILDADDSLSSDASATLRTLMETAYKTLRSRPVESHQT